MNRILFITGTDTGVGKTLFTGLLLHHLRQQGHKTLAMKPFCSGHRADARLLLSLEKGDITLDEINPYYFPKPLAPWVATPRNQQKVILKAVLNAIAVQKKRCQTLLIEGSGGIFVPVNEKILVADLILKLSCRTIVIAHNRLGTINHTMLTVKALQTMGCDDIAVVLMSIEKPDMSTKTNRQTLQHFLPKTPIFTLPFLGRRACKTSAIINNAKIIQKPLAQIYAHDNLSSF